MSFELVYQLTNDTDDNDQTYNYVQSKSYAFYHSQIDSKKIYRITYYNQQSLQQHQQQEISPLHFKLHLKQLLTNYLAPKEIYKQNLYRNMMQDNFNEEVMDGTPSFRNASDDYTQDYENSLHLDHFVQKLHVNVVNDYLQKWLVRSTSKLLN
uniref:Uncharacterized protein n=1 Tax=Rhizophagus irregularis (strain DAOM 181602 / DAOM 197198 / MUCL 43194) TaxID=747089 RepID=U9TWM5_RHIID